MYSKSTVSLDKYIFVNLLYYFHIYIVYVCRYSILYIYCMYTHMYTYKKYTYRYTVCLCLIEFTVSLFFYLLSC